MLQPRNFIALTTGSLSAGLIVKPVLCSCARVLHLLGIHALCCQLCLARCQRRLELLNFGVLSLKRPLLLGACRLDLQ